MDEIADGAGVSKGALYWHYRSKKDLFLHLIDYWVERIAGEIRSATEGEDRPDEILHRLCDTFITQFARHPDVFEAETEFWALAHRDPEAREKVHKVYGEFFHLIEKTMERGVQEGSFVLEDSHLAALTLLINLESCVWFTLFSPDGVDYGTYLTYFQKHFISSLGRERRQT